MNKKSNNQKFVKYDRCPRVPEPTNPSLNIYLPAFSGGVAVCWAGECFREHFSYSTVIVQFYCFAEKKTRLETKMCTTASPGVDIGITTEIFLTNLGKHLKIKIVD